METKISVPNGIIFDFTNLFGAERLDLTSFAAKVAEQGPKLKEAVQAIRETGTAKAHLSKDGTPEHVYFPRMPYIKEGNPNTPASIAKLKAYGENLKNYDAVLFLGIGGSYLGSKVLVDAIGGLSWNNNALQRHGYPRVYFSGNNVDCEANAEITEELKYIAGEEQKATGKPFKLMLVTISKSGTTLETTSAFLYFYEALKAVETIAVDCTMVTDLAAPLEKAPLLQLAQKFNWPCFDVKEGIGGRFSVMTDLGLLALLAVGGDIEKFLEGARAMDQYCLNAKPEEEPALINALAKYEGYVAGADLEVFMPYSMRLKSLSEWYIQLLAESLGKRLDREGNLANYGRTPIVAVGTTDMHAQTQQHQEGRRNKVVQFVEVANQTPNIVLNNPFPEVTAFNKYAELSLHRALEVAMMANEQALTSDNRYNARYTLPCINEYNLGQIMYFLMLSVAYEGEIANIDAFDQPGVEVYKRIMNQYL